MKNRECRRKFYVLPLFAVLIAAALMLGACTTPEKAKAQHVARGQALLKEKKFQEASLEFRSALQIDDKLAEAHWGLANAYEGLQRYQEAFEEMRATASLDPISSQKVEELVYELRKDMTIVIVTHNMQQAARVSDVTAFFLLGELVEVGATRTIFTNPTDPRTEAYITGRFG